MSFRRLADPRLLVPLLVIVLATLTASRVFTTPLWGDEFRTWRDGIEKPLGAVLTWTHNPDHAPLGHLLARLGASLFGVEHAWALRLGPWLCGLACVPAIWWMGRTIWSDGVGLLMATMLVVDPTFVGQMVLARMYAPLMLAAILVLGLAGSILIRPETPWRRVVLLGLAIGLGIWSHAQIYAVVIALLLTTIGLCFTTQRRTAGTLLISILIGAALGGQGLWKIAHRHDAEAVTAPDITDAPGGQLEDAIHKVTGKAWLTYTILSAAIVGFVVLSQKPSHRPIVALLAIVIMLAVVNLLVAARYRPVAHARYLMVMQPALWLAMSVVFIELCRSRYRFTLGVASVCFFVGVSVFEVTRIIEDLSPHPLARPFADAAQLIRKEIQPGDRFAVAARSPYGMYARYYGLSQDERLDDAITPSKARDARLAADAARLDEGTIWLLCVVSRDRGQRAPYAKFTDDPRWLTNAIAERRKLPPDGLTDLRPVASWKAVVLKIDTQLNRVAPPFVAK